MELLTAIIVLKDAAHPRPEFLKYRNIPRRDADLRAFIAFAVKKGLHKGIAAQCVNFYAKDEKEFLFRRYCNVL